MIPDKKKQFGAKIIKVEGSSSSEDDADAVLLTEELESEFLKVLSHLKKKDSNLYSENKKYFSSDNLKHDDAVPSRNQSISSPQEYKEWLRGQINKIEDPEAKQELEALRSFWTNPAINEGEQFLRDYILNKKFLDPDDSFCIEKELKNLSEEEKEEEIQTVFEEKYNCRFENPDKEFFEKFPQTMKKAFGKKKHGAIVTEENIGEKKANMLKSDRSNQSLTNRKSKKRKSDENLLSRGTGTESNQKKKKLMADDPSIPAKKQKNIEATKSNINTPEINSDSKNVNIGKAEHLKKFNETESNKKEVFNLLNAKKLGKADNPKWANKKFEKLPRTTKTTSVTTSKESKMEKEASVLDSGKSNPSLTKHKNKKRKKDTNLKNNMEIESNQDKKKTLETNDQSIPAKRQKHIEPKENNINNEEINNSSKNVNIDKAEYLKLPKTDLKSKGKYKVFKNTVKLDKTSLNDVELKKILNLLKAKKSGRREKPRWNNKQKIKQPRKEVFNKPGVKTKNKEEKKKISNIVKKIKDRKRKPRHRILKNKSVSK